MPKGGRQPGAGRPKGAKDSQRRLSKGGKQAIKAQLLVDEALSVTATVEAIRRGMTYDPRALFDAKGNLKRITDLTEREAWALAGFEIIVKNAAAGDGHVDTVHKIKLIDRRGYVELAAKHQGMLTEKVEVTGSDALIEALLAGRARAADSRKG